MDVATDERGADVQAQAITPVIGLALARGGDRFVGAIRFATVAPAAGTTVRATAATAAGPLEVDGALPPAGAAVVVVVRPEP